MTRTSRLSREVAEATRATGAAIHKQPTHANVLVDTAKQLQRLQTKRAKLRKALRTVDSDIRLTKRELKALAQAIGKGE